jgi:IS5 family transposase
VLRQTDPQTTIWELLLPEEAMRLPAELVKVDAYLDDECFIAPWRALFSKRLGRPSVPIDTLVRLLSLKHRYGLGYESLCREVADSISWRRFCRIPLDRPVPHPTTLIKLVCRAGPEVTEQLNAALVAKLAQGKLLRARKLRVDTTVVEADIDDPTDADLLERAVRKLGGLVRRVKGRGAASRTRFRDRGRAAGRRMQAAGPHPAAAHRGGDGRGGSAHRRGRPDRQADPAAGADGGAQRPPGVGSSTRRRVAGSAGRRAGRHGHRDRAAVGPDRPAAGRQPGDPQSAGLAGDPDARPIRKGKPGRPSEVGYTLLLAEDERGFVADHQVEQGNPPDAPQLVAAVRRVIAVTGRPPASVVGDRGFGTAANDQAVAALASGGSGCNAPAPQARPGWR